MSRTCKHQQETRRRLEAVGAAREGAAARVNVLGLQIPSCCFFPTCSVDGVDRPPKEGKTTRE
jgi:hypothetical protein